MQSPQADPRNPVLTRWLSEQCNNYDLKCHGEQTSLTPLLEAKLDAIGFTWLVARSSTKDAPAGGDVVSSAVRPEEARSENKARSEKIGVVSPDRIASG